MGDTQFLNRSVVGDRDRRAAVTNSGFEDADEAGDLGEAHLGVLTNPTRTAWWPAFDP